jgi:hypothetical protein
MANPSRSIENSFGLSAAGPAGFLHRQSRILMGVIQGTLQRQIRRPSVGMIRKIYQGQLRLCGKVRAPRDSVQLMARMLPLCQMA